jgi:divalent metal cation (Fe/Co/Zn/Cd) transporter
LSAGTASIDAEIIARYRRIYLRAWTVSLAIIVIELTGASLAGSAALRADVYHVAGDMVVASAPLAVIYARRRPRHLDTILLCGGSAVALVLMAIGVELIAGAWRTLYSAPASVEIHGWLLSGFALLAACANLWQHRVLSQVQSAHRDTAHLGFHFHVQMDLLKNLSLPILGALIALHRLPNEADSWAALCIGAWIGTRGFILLIGSALAFHRRERLVEH